MGFRIGVDLGGSKIEGAAIDASGVVRLRRRIPTPAGDYHGTIAAIVAWSRTSNGKSARRRRSGSACRARSRRRRGWSRTPIRPGSTAARCGAISRAALGRAGAPCQRRQLLCPVRGDATVRRRCHRIVFGVILGTGVGGGIVVGRAPACRRQRDRRRMGAQPAALAACRRTAGPRLLLRPVGLHRDISVGPGNGRGSSPPHRRGTARG